MTVITLDLPEEIFSALRRSPTEFVQEFRLAVDDLQRELNRR
jgi:hypothetical protein